MIGLFYPILLFGKLLLDRVLCPPSVHDIAEVKSRYALVVNQVERPVYHWVNQIIAWTLPIITTISLMILEWKGKNVIGDCHRVWYVRVACLTQGHGLPIMKRIPFGCRWDSCIFPYF